MNQKRLITIQDLSCFGKCSITAALPVISALGAEAVVLPTAVLSTHTGEFKNYTFHPLYSEFDKITSHWEELGIEFDAIYIGYIGSEELIDSVNGFLDKFSGNAVIFLDPAMADNGKYYSGLDESYAKKLRELCKRADIISPNMTEAMILSGRNPEDYKKISDVREIAEILSELSDNVIITGVHNKTSIQTIGYDGFTKELCIADKPIRDGVFYGSGDLFSSAFIGMYINGASFDESVKNASEFVNSCIINTLDEHDKYWYGLKFEQSLGMLTDYYRNLKKQRIATPLSHTDQV